jgi:O-antigen/teichoic acid export membrane protein
MHRAQIASSTLWQMASQIVMAALSIVTIKFVTLGLDLELAGNYNTAYGYLQLFGILADFGLYAVAVREVSRAEHKEKVLGTILVLRCLILALSMGVALFFVWINPQWRGTPLPMAVLIASLVPIFTLMAGVLRTVFQVEYRMHFVFIAEVAQRVLTVTLIGIPILFFGARHSENVRLLYYMLGVGGLGALLLFLVSLICASRLMVIRPSWDRALLRRIGTQSLPYGLAFLCTALYRQFDVTMIALLRPDYELQNAYYGFVQRMMDMAYLLPTFLLNSTLPLLAARDKAGEDTRGLLGTTLLSTMLIGVTALLFSIVWARPLTELLTNERYLSTDLHPGSDTALMILSGSMFLNGFVLFAFYSLLTRDRWKPLVGTLLLGVVFSLLSNLLLIPRWGFVGASITSVLTHAILALLLLPQSYQALPFTVSRDALLRILGFAGLLLLFLLLAKPMLTSSLPTALALAVASGWLAAAAIVTGLHKMLWK